MPCKWIFIQMKTSIRDFSQVIIASETAKQERNNAFAQCSDTIYTYIHTYIHTYIQWERLLGLL